MQRRCANTPPTSFENTSPGCWQPCSPSSLSCSGELLQAGYWQEQDPGLPGLKDCELTGKHSSTLQSLQICSQANDKCIARIHSAPLHHVSESLGSAFSLTTHQSPAFRNKIWSEKGQIKPFTSWVCIKRGKQSLLQPCEALLYLERCLKLALAKENAEFNYHLVSIAGSWRGQTYAISFIPYYTTNFMCDISNSSASPGPHFPVHFLKSLWFLHRQVRSSDADLCHYKVSQLCFISARNLAQHFFWNCLLLLQTK